MNMYNITIQDNVTFLEWIGHVNGFFRELGKGVAADTSNTGWELFYKNGYSASEAALEMICQQRTHA